jgi:hypothetical protein
MGGGASFLLSAPRLHRQFPKWASAEFLQDETAAQNKNLRVNTFLTRALPAYLAAGVAGYLCAISFATAANLINLAEIGARIDLGDVLRTWLFDLWGMTPRFELARYGTVLLIGFAIAFPVAALILWGVERSAAGRRIASLLYPLAGAMAVGTGLTIMFQQYEVTAVAGARGLGFWAQCLAGGIAGLVFQLVLRRGRA